MPNQDEHQKHPASNEVAHVGRPTAGCRQKAAEPQAERGSPHAPQTHATRSGPRHIAAAEACLEHAKPALFPHHRTLLYRRLPAVRLPPGPFLDTAQPFPPRLRSGKSASPIARYTRLGDPYRQGAQQVDGALGWRLCGPLPSAPLANAGRGEARAELCGPQCAASWPADRGAGRPIHLLCRAGGGPKLVTQAGHARSFARRTPGRSGSINTVMARLRSDYLPVDNNPFGPVSSRYPVECQASSSLARRIGNGWSRNAVMSALYT